METHEKAASARTPEDPTGPVRILIADDHELVRQGMRAILSCEPGWEVCGEATTGRQALALAFELKPHVIVLDIGLPEMSGLEVTRRVRSALAAKVLIVTMDDTDRAVQEAVNAGANGYMLKADAGRTLLKAVRAILRDGEFFSEGVRAAAGLAAVGGRPGPRRGISGRLSSREHEVLALLAAGRSNKEVGVALGISTKTVDTHRARIMAKLELHSMSELVRYAIRNGVIQP
jgi:two-component system response regulator NreC